LRGQNWAFPFHIHTDELEKGLGEALGQVEDKFPYAIYFLGKNLSKDKINYMFTKKEIVVVVHFVNKFKNYIIGY